MRIPIGIDEYVIRNWDREDEEALAKYANNRKIWRNLMDSFPHPYNRGHARDWLRRTQREEPRVNFAIASSHEAIGGIGLKPLEDVAYRTSEVGYWLGEPLWGKGIATAALKAFTEWAFRESGLGLERLFSGIYAWNPASARVLV
jgi:[ribosomal protein S5]-alanine N-acetyltransferase